jgi:hypothetical protein
MKEKPEKPKIFLSEGDVLPWEKPLKSGYFRGLLAFNGETKLLESLGMDVVNEELSDYYIQATAAKYLASVIRVGENKYRDINSKIEGIPENLIIFNGSVVIYSSGKILGTELQGFDLESTGKIWLAREPTDVLKSDKGLYSLVFGNEKTEKGKIERIEAILNGHEQIKRDKESERIGREHASWKSGKNQEHERIFGTFGKGGSPDY